uniref:Uncharacterized protein n=1 Tax=Fagus sylvatica TaxID=28930 RepID=A0A2N9FP71_FAGSY
MHPPSSSQCTDPPCTPASDSLPIAHQKGVSIPKLFRMHYLTRVGDIPWN